MAEAFASILPFIQLTIIMLIPWSLKLRLLQSPLTIDELLRILSLVLMKTHGLHSNGLLPMLMDKALKIGLTIMLILSEFFIYGDSAGGNIAQHMVMRFPREILDGFNVVGIVLAHTYFWGKEHVGDETTDAETRASIEKMWRAACPGTSGCDDPLINPFVGSTLANLGCKRVQVHVAEKDLMRDRGWFYYEKLKESGWGGEAEIVESKGEPHIFYLLNPTCDSAVAMRKKIASFFNEI
ncbi:putative carboxylesterase 12 [Citrus sinensis]|uniref:Carboxylesterase 12 n=1 Tax=Citrus sinensis TaxID=2711 RepID=A0ACB8IF30_CITSI|nr:putative carboxylesterase 12 [Citrus sinensis]